LTNADKQKMVEIILSQSNQLNQITNNVLQIVRLDSDQLNLHKDWESAEELVGSAVKLCRQRSPKRQIDVSVDTGLPLLWCDALLVVQLLENLIENAIKYSPGNEAIHVTAYLKINSLVFSVADRGAGVPLELADKIFDAFQRGTQNSKTGSGIGLTLCQMIAGIHGGSIAVAAREGGGSVFTCMFPIKENMSSPPLEKN
jgi:two-component system sensor histidine kinase KdpD